MSRRSFLKRPIEGLEPDIEVTRECSKRLFGNQFRFSILERFARDETPLTRQDLAREFGLMDSALSTELQNLAESGLLIREAVRSPRVKVFYHQNPELDWDAIGEGLAEVRRAIERSGAAE